MEIINKNKGVIALAFILAIGYFAYKTFFPATLDVNKPAANGERLIKLAGELERVNFDQELFSSPGYIFLSDFSAEVAPQPAGRTNPFNPIGRD
ncbi:hypothetical protein KW807_02310 [Candidatus Parcubacteria bacterium]|nr:hypothetical protein [Candidatus Parcubacteria bacterium]